MQAEKTQKTKEHYSKDTGIQITAAIWVHTKRLGAKMQQVCDGLIIDIISNLNLIFQLLDGPISCNRSICTR